MTSAAGSSSFLLSTASGIGDGREFDAAFSAAIIVNKVSASRPQNTRMQLCRFLCELGRQLQRGGSFDYGASLPLSRGALAEAMGTSLTRVKRALALLALSRVIETDGENLRVIDWKRACDYARVDPATLKIRALVEDDELRLVPEEPPAVQVTISGEPANFV